MEIQISGGANCTITMEHQIGISPKIKQDIQKNADDIKQLRNDLDTFGGELGGIETNRQNIQRNKESIDAQGRELESQSKRMDGHATRLQEVENANGDNSDKILKNANAINKTNEDLKQKQSKTDPNLATDDKTMVGAINETVKELEKANLEIGKRQPAGDYALNDDIPYIYVKDDTLYIEKEKDLN